MLLFSLNLIIAFALFLSHSIAAMDASEVTKLLQQALLVHKSGTNFDSALKLYKVVLPYLSGATASTVNSNIGAIYLNIIGKL